MQVLHVPALDAVQRGPRPLRPGDGEGGRPRPRPRHRRAHRQAADPHQGREREYTENILQLVKIFYPLWSVAA